MHWEWRLRDMILAGGTLVAAACSGSSGSPSAGSPEDASSDGSLPNDAPNDAPNDVTFTESGGCCNASSDPCCLAGLDCSEGDGGAFATCEQAAMNCEAMHGFYDAQADGAGGCMFPQMGEGDGAADASPDAATDATADASTGDAADAGGE